VKKLLSVLLAISILFGISSPVLAIDDPDTDPQVSASYVYEFSDGSVGVLVDTYLDYAVLPTETATEAYLVVLYDTVSATQFKAVAPYTFVDSGYGRNLVWMSFSATEVTTLGIDSADIANYEVWLTGNPALSWVGDPPKTISAIDQWNDTGDMSVLLALRILYYADVLELAWSLDMVESTSEGNRLTLVGESYFENVIAGARTLAPGAFASSTRNPDFVTIDYDTTFGAVAASSTATVVGSPVTLIEGVNTITVSDTGLIILILNNYVTGNFTNVTGTATGSPITLYPNTNTVEITGAGNFTANVTRVDTSTRLADTVTGTGMDLTVVAARFNMSRWMFSGLLWVVISLLVVVMAYKSKMITGATSKLSLPLFGIVLISGTLLGMLHPIISSLLGILVGGFIGWQLFMRSESLHKGFMFMMWMFFVTSLMGNFAATGQSSIQTTRLTADVAVGEVDSISVQTTSGFPDHGLITIGDETIRYPAKTSTTFVSTSFGGFRTSPLVRGSMNTEVAAHSEGADVRTVESWVFNASVNYKIARLVDNAGALDYLAMPVKLLDLIFTFFVLPLSFLGTELAVLSYIWSIIAIGMIVGLILALVGGRRV